MCVVCCIFFFFNEINVGLLYFSSVMFLFNIFRGFYATKLYLLCIYNPFIHFLSIDLKILFPT